MESQLQASSTFAATAYADSYFEILPSDDRFINVTYQRFPPESIVDNKTIKFALSRYEAGNCYLIQDTCIELVAKITKSDGTLPDKTKIVAPINNVLHSAFETVRVYLNDNSVIQNTTLYHLRSYITHTLTYSSHVKASLLESQGYYADVEGQFQASNVDLNTGLGSRNLLFREGNVKGAEYSKEGVRFFGKLNLDLSSCEAGLPPGTKVRIELDKAPDSFILFRDSADTENYKFKITDCNLYVPVAQLATPVFNQLNSLLTEKSVALHFRRTEITEVSLPKDKAEYFSDNLFSADIPCRVVVWYNFIYLLLN